MQQERLLYKPYIMSAQEAHSKKIVTYQDDGSALFRIGKTENLIPKKNQYDLTQATIFGLNERLTMTSTSPVLEQKGITLREEFNNEWEKYTEALENAEGYSDFEYGFYVFYEETGDLVRYADPYWHKVVAVSSSSKLITDPERSLSWADIRALFAKTVIGVAGCSVGSNIIHNVMMDMRPDSIKVADKGVYKMENINRIRANYFDLVSSNADKKHLMDLGLGNKSETVAKQLYHIDPFLDIFIYNEGISEENITEFFLGDEKEPPIDIIVDEVDDPRTKILLRIKARELGVPLLMFTDIGSAIQADILRYDKDKNLPLTYGTEDDILVSEMESMYDQGVDRESFFAFIDKLIGTTYRQDELLEIIEERSEIPTSTIIPQLGSTAAATGGIAAEIIARLVLGHQFPSRMIINKHTFDVQKFD